MFNAKVSTEVVLLMLAKLDPKGLSEHTRLLTLTDLQRREVAAETVPEIWRPVYQEFLASAVHKELRFDPHRWMAENFPVVEVDDQLELISEFSTFMGSGYLDRHVLPSDVCLTVVMAWNSNEDSWVILTEHGVFIAQMTDQEITERVIGYCICHDVPWMHYDYTKGLPETAEIEDETED